MAAISTKNRVVNVVILAGVVVLLGNEQVITQTLGLYLGASSLVVVTLGFLWLRESIKESGLIDGDLNNAQQVTDLVNALPSTKTPESELTSPDGPGMK
jgi:hypothetical protein